MYLEILFSLIVTFCAYKLLIRYAKNLNLVDIPNIRSSHVVPTIRGFGLVIFASFCVTLLIFNLSFFIENTYLLSAVFLIVLLGLVDDIKETLPIIKIGTVIVVYLLLYIDGFLITNLGIFFGVDIELYFLVSILFTLFALVAFTNAFNLIDGLDGLSGLISMIILFSFLFIGYKNNNQFLIIIPILFITSIVVFIFYNWHPAKVFLGDSGSLMIGFIISVLGIKSLDYIEPISILYIAGIPIIDSIIVFFRRILAGQSPFVPDKKHLHHIVLLYFNGSVEKTVTVIAIFQAALSIIGVIFIANVEDSFLSLIVFLAIIISIYRILTSSYFIKLTENQ